MNDQSATIRELALACCDNSAERWYFCPMIDDYTHLFLTYQITTHIYLKIESYNLQSKNLVHISVDFYVQNALKLSPTVIFNS